MPLQLFGIALGLLTPTWLTDYEAAVHRAIESKKDLLIYVFDEKKRLEAAVNHPYVLVRTRRYVCLKIPVDYKLGTSELLQHEAFQEMGRKPGLLIVSLKDEASPHFQHVVSVLPDVPSRYAWVPRIGPEEICILLDLPDGSLTQRSMIYALAVHPERPQSIMGQLHPVFVEHAFNHSQKQAREQMQHHADLLTASRMFQEKVGIAPGSASEVVAESWGHWVGGENVLEAAFSCVDAWRQSPGHWSAVSRYHRYFGYDLARGRNGVWYATGIFAD